jgi:NADH:ubiquinone oxidoreductase subunit F (NADH-binding)
MPLLSNQPPRIQLPVSADIGHHLVSLLRVADLRGCGGARFPTAVKINSSLGRRPHLIINVCDGEPLVAKDHVLVHTSPTVLADGAALVARAVQARSLVFAVPAGSAAELAVRRLLVAEAELLAGAEVLCVPPRYVSSEETSLASLLNGGDARPLFKEQPLSLLGPGPGRVPVLVLNAETCARIALIWCAEPAAASSRLMTITGAVVLAGVVEAPGTTTVTDLIHAAGGLTQHPQAVLLGGYGGTWCPWEWVGHLTLDDLVARGLSLGAGLVHVLGEGCPLQEVGMVLRYLAGESAGQCGPCMFGLPAIATDWSQLSDVATATPALERLTLRLPKIDGRGACRHPDGVVRFAASALSTFKDHIDAHLFGHCPRSVAMAGPRSAV